MQSSEIIGPAPLKLDTPRRAPASIASSKSEAPSESITPSTARHAGAEAGPLQPRLAPYSGPANPVEPDILDLDAAYVARFGPVPRSVYFELDDVRLHALEWGDPEAPP